MRILFLSRIRHQNELTERDWENAVQGLGNGRPIEPQVNGTESHTITYTWLHGHCLRNSNSTIAVYCLANTL